MANTQNLDLVKPLGTDHALVSVLNSNMDKIDAYAGAVNAGLDGLREGLGILADGNTHAAITSGQFVYVKNHQTLPQGLYQATTNIAANGTLSTSNLTADPKGGLNTLSEQIGNIDGRFPDVMYGIYKEPTFTNGIAQVDIASELTTRGFVSVASIILAQFTTGSVSSDVIRGCDKVDATTIKIVANNTSVSGARGVNIMFRGNRA